MRRLEMTLLLVIGAMLCGCRDSGFSTTQSVVTADRMPTGFAAWTDEIPPYEFVSGDRIKVQFLLTPEMNEDAVVGPDNMIAIRAGGQVMAGGRTAMQLQAAIAKSATAMLSKPIVTVSLLELPKAPVFVGGEVGRPGSYDIGGRRRGTLEAVQVAGGFAPEARMDEVVLIRRNANDRPMLRVVDLRGFVEGSDERVDVPLVAGDIVFVPRNRISEVDLWVDQFITRFLPFSRSFGYAVNRNGQAF